MHTYTDTHHTHAHTHTHTCIHTHARTHARTEGTRALVLHDVVDSERSVVTVLYMTVG